MNRPTVLILLALSISLLAVPISAQDAPETPVPTQAPTDTPEAEPGSDTGEWIDNATQWITAEYQPERGTVEVTIHSEIPQQITISDSGAFVEGGQVDQRTIFLKPAETRTFRFPITVVDHGLGQEFAGVSITTSKTLYAVPLESSSPLIGGPWTVGDVQLVGLVVGSGVSIITLLILLRSRFDLDADPERVA